MPGTSFSGGTRRAGLLWIFVCWCSAHAAPAVAQFVVRDVEARVDQRQLHVSTSIEFDLSEQAQLAVENGVPLVVLTEFALMGPGLLYDQTLLEVSVGQQLRYHSLADRYVVENVDGGEIDTYASVNDALRSMGAFRSQAFALPDGIDPASPEYTLEVRSRLDINRLPAPLWPLAFFSPSWRLASDWTTWQIETP